MMPVFTVAAKTRTDFLIYEAMRQDIAPERALAIIDTLLTDRSHDLPYAKETALLKRQVEHAMAIGRYSAASAALSRLMERKEEFPVTDVLKMELNSGICSFYAGEYASAIKSAFAVLAEKKPESLSDLDVGAYILLSNVSNRIGAPGESDHFLETAHSILSKIDSDSMRRQEEYRILLGESSRSLIMEDYDSAYRLLQKSDSLGVHNISPYCLETNLAIVYSMEGADDMAERYYLDILHSPGVHYNKSVALNNYSEFLMDHGRINEALEVMDINLPLLQTVDAKHALGIRQILRFKALAAKGALGPSIESADSAINITLELMAQESRRMYSQVYSQFEADRIAKDYERLKQANTRLWIFLWIGLLLLVGAAVWIILAVRKGRSRAKEIEVAQSRLEEMKQEWLSKTESMREELDHRNRQITRQELQTNQASGKPAADWATFEVYFEKVEPQFYEELSRRHPALTPGERRMCAFIRTGMKTPEIATLCNRSSRTVESMKYRLKKKLDLPAGMTLDAYLTTLGTT